MLSAKLGSKHFCPTFGMVYSRTAIEPVTFQSPGDNVLEQFKLKTFNQIKRGKWGLMDLPSTPLLWWACLTSIFHLILGSNHVLWVFCFLDKGRKITKNLWGVWYPNWLFIEVHKRRRLQEICLCWLSYRRWCSVFNPTFQQDIHWYIKNTGMCSPISPEDYL